MTKQKFDIEGMHCAVCSANVNKTVQKLEGVKSVNVNLLQNSMSVIYNEKVCSDEVIISAVKAAGFNATLSSFDEITDINEKNKKPLFRLLISAFFLLSLVYFSMGNMAWGFPAPNFLDHSLNPAGNAIIQLLMLIPILIIYNGYFVSGFKKLIKGKPNMDSLIAVGSTASILYSLFSTVMILAQNDASVYTHNLYYESAGMILTLVSLGKYLETLSKRKTTAAIKRLYELAPKTAVIIIDGKETEIPIEKVNVGDVFIVKNGAKVPVDGEIIEGGASFDQSNITGESMPVHKTVGEEVFSSTVITAGYVIARATKVGKDTSFSNIIKLVEEASGSKAPVSKIADKISGIFVPVIFALAIITFTVNLLVQIYSVGESLSGAIEIALRFSITVIVIACPCALGLATPVAIMVGTGKGAENGLLIKNAEILEKAHLIKTVVLDKTGTITEGKPKIADVIISESENEKEILSAVYSLEKKSEHPLSRAIVEYAESQNSDLFTPSEYLFVEGKGVKGKIGENEYYIGNAKIYEEVNAEKDEFFALIERKAQDGNTPLIIFKNKKPVGVIAVKDSVKEYSAAAIKELKKRGIKVIMLTGDNIATAEKISKEVGIDNVIAGVLPSEKSKVVNSLKTDGKRLVAMVGDGVNDAPALTAADIGIAIGGGSDVAMESGDVVLLRKDLSDVINYIDLSKRVLTTIKLCLFWAFFYNLICVVLASGALYYVPNLNLGLKPAYGSIAMSLSSVSVVLTALTINLFKPKKPNGKIVI